MAPFRWPFVTSSKDTTKVTLCTSNPKYDAALRLDTFNIAGDAYTRKDSVQQSKQATRKKTSPIWKHGEVLVRHKDSKEVYYCYNCELASQPQILLLMNGNQGPLGHLSSHNLNKQGEHVAVVLEGEQPDNGSQTKITFTMVVKFEEFKRLLIRWIVYCHMAFRMVENIYFRELVCCLSQSIGQHLPRAGATIRKWVIHEYQNWKEKVVLELLHALSDVHISFDIWTSPNHFSIISVYGHYISRSGNRCTKLLAFRRVRGDHSGENVANVLWEVFREYRLLGKVGHFVADNASNNDTAIEVLLKRMYPQMKPHHRKARRLRCFGHIANLCAKSLLLGKGSGKAMKELELKVEKGAFDAVNDFWLKRGAIGKLHNIIRWIRASTQRIDEFSEVAGGEGLEDFNKLKLIQDNSTRWNSFYYMIGRALTIKERIDKFCMQNRDNDTIRTNQLSISDWHQLDSLHNTLQVFEISTIDTQGEHKHLYDWYPTLCFMLDTLDAYKTEYSEEAAIDSSFSYLSTCCEASWGKAEKYFKLTDETPIYYAAVMLNPVWKHDWFKDIWSSGTKEQKKWIDTTLTQVEDIWTTLYKPVDQVAAEEPPAKHRKGKGRAKTTASQPAEESDEDDLRSVLNNRYKRRRIDQSLVTPIHKRDSLEKYLASSCEIDPLASKTTAQIKADKIAPYDALRYWYHRKDAEPELARFAFDTLALPLMSDSPERSFSAGRDMITYRRSNLADTVIEACSCLRNWYGAPSTGDIDSEDEIVKDYEEGFSTRSEPAVDNNTSEIEIIP